MERSVFFFATMVLLGLVPVAHADEPFKPYLACLKMVRQCSIGKSFDATLGAASELAVMNGPHGGKDGFYAFAQEDAYFHEFPPAPPPVLPYIRPAPSFFNLYGFLTNILHPPQLKPDTNVYFKLEPGFHDVVYLGYKRAEGGELSLDLMTKIPANAAAVYLPGAGGECHADAESRALIVAETLARIGSVYSTFESAPRPDKGDVTEEYDLPGREKRITYQRADCIKALEFCTDSEDLRSAVTTEKKKFGL